jgi:hypothetical protein
VLVGPQVGPVVGIDAGPGDVGGGAAWSTDATRGVGVPANSTEWDAVAAAAGHSRSPSSLFGCQEASGNLLDSIGAIEIAANDTRTYENAIAGWTRKAVGISDGVSGYWTTNGGPDPSTESAAMLAYLRIDASTAERSMLFLNAVENDYVAINVTAGGLLKAYIDANTATGAVNYAAGAVFPVMLVYNRTAGSAFLCTADEKLPITYGAIAANGAKYVGLFTPPTMKLLMLAWFEGADAEFTLAEAKAELVALGWSVSWSP